MRRDASPRPVTFLTPHGEMGTIARCSRQAGLTARSTVGADSEAALPLIARAAAATAAGVMVGCRASALIGPSLPDPIRRKFDAHIRAGWILLVIDGDRELLQRA